MIGCMKKLCALSVAFALCAVLFSACGVPAPQAAAAPAAPAKMFRKIADHQVLVLLGPDYADRPEILAPIIEEYGLAGSGGMILQLRYPDSFTVDKKIRLSILSDTAQLPSATVLLTVGSPEGFVRELVKIRASKPEMRIISLFSADEVLPLEGVSSLVLDYAQAGELLAEENTAVLSDPDLSVLVLAAILSGEERDAALSPIEGLAVALDASRRILKSKASGSGWKFAAYIDPDTNLRSRNHVILELPSGGSS